MADAIQSGDQASALRALVAQSSGAAALREGAGKRARLITVTSGKGGVGKTNVAVNLAIRLSKMGRRVVLLDADLGTANADVLCNLSPVLTLAHVVAGRAELAAVMVDGPGGFRLIPGASGLAQMAALSTAERERLMLQMRELENEADVILIDTGAGVGPNVLGFAVAADQVLVVTTPEPPAVTDAYAVIKTLWRQRPEVDVRVLVNQVASAAEAKDVFSRLEAVSRRFLSLELRYAGHIVSDPQVGLSVRRRVPFTIDVPASPAGACLSELAHRLDRHAREPSGGGLLRRMTQWLAR